MHTTSVVKQGTLAIADVNGIEVALQGIFLIALILHITPPNTGDRSPKYSPYLVILRPRYTIITIK